MSTNAIKPQPTVDYTALLTLPDSDNIRIKAIVKEKLLTNPDILYLLNAPEDIFLPKDYFGTYILPYRILDGSPSEPHSYLCYETMQKPSSENSGPFKTMQLVFSLLIYGTESLDASSGIPRHDLISAFLIRDINWSEAFGSKCCLVKDQAGYTKCGYISRTLTFQCRLPNGLTKTNLETGETYFCNNDSDKEWY